MKAKRNSVVPHSRNSDADPFMTTYQHSTKAIHTFNKEHKPDSPITDNKVAKYRIRSNNVVNIESTKQREDKIRSQMEILRKTFARQRDEISSLQDGAYPLQKQRGFSGFVLTQ